MIGGDTVYQVVVDGEVWMTLAYAEQADRALARCRRDAWFAKAKTFEVRPIARHVYEAQVKEAMRPSKRRQRRLHLVSNDRRKRV